MADDADVLARLVDGFAARRPAVTRRGTGDGTAWYVGTVPDEGLFDTLVERSLSPATVDTVGD